MQLLQWEITTLHLEQRWGLHLLVWSRHPNVEMWRKKPLKFTIKNKLVLYFLPLAREQGCYGTAELRDQIFVWVEVQNHSWKQTASKFNMLYLLFFKLPHHHFSPIRLWHPSHPQPKEARGEEGEPDTINECPPRQRALISRRFEIFN